MRCRLDVPGAVNVTLNELEKHLLDFDRDKEVIPTVVDLTVCWLLTLSRDCVAKA